MLDFTKLANKNILVIGDAMLDQYWHGDCQRISPEAPVPIVKITNEEFRAGGAANVALNIAKLGVKTTLIAAAGDDPAKDKLVEILDIADIHSIYLDVGAPTINKLRVLGQEQQLLRCDREVIKAVPSEKIIEAIDNLADEPDLVILSDYAKGMLLEPRPIIEYFNSKNIKVLVDPKKLNFADYSNAFLIKPNLAEFKLQAGAITSKQDLTNKAKSLIAQNNIENILVTLGKDGMTLINSNTEVNFASKAQEVFDITGAGDTVIAVLAVSLVAGNSLQDAVKIANLAAGFVVSKTGTHAISKQELSCVLNPDEKLANIPSKDKTIVFTNGCFDILHPGHIDYLAKAKKLGDYLIVAINNDESIKRLKGPFRPINDLKARTKMLEALESVDLVVSFSEDTPIEILTKINPDILVKGGDYQAEDIVGYDFMQKQGKAVKILPFLDGFSTSKIIDKIQAQQAELI